ncbi:MAG: hypothetical protein M3071_21410 [Actinomycetota bacterium]|nr:hypothetical protein [Actinomycetota bacterium]
MLAVIQRRGPAQELRATIDRLPLHVREAVLDGIKGQRIIAGAHADAFGGVCPMVAADVHLPWKTVSKASVEYAQQAARAWDRYAEASGSSHTATKRQLLALTSMLEASILQETAVTQMPLSDVIAEYERTKSGRAPADVRDALPSSLDVPAARPSTLDVPAAPPRSRKRRNTGERDRTTELGERGGWAWLRPFRSYDEYEETLLRALSELDGHERQLEELQAR